MKRATTSVVAIAITVFIALLIPAAAEIVYTPVNVSIPVGGYYYIDLNRDGIADFVLRSRLIQDYCQAGDGYIWTLSITPAQGNAVAIASGVNAAALVFGAPVGPNQSYLLSTALMTELAWGNCGSGLFGEWLNLPNRYLGLLLRQTGANEIQYGWAKASEVAYIDPNGHLQTSVILLGFAYETVPGRVIAAGQTSD
ncbi:MAG TPA: hypothetical protein VKB58_11285 [Terriglobales bacterium]|jgi:hypothetical protein|nr:hypothetical protein [Terriglobales bacterium]